MKPVPGGFASKKGSCENIFLSTSNTHRTPLGLNIFFQKPDSERCQKRSRKKTQRSAAKRLTDRLQDSKRVQKCQFFVFTFFMCFVITGSRGLGLTPERHEGLKMQLRGTKTVPAGPKSQPSSNEPRHPDAKSAKNPAPPTAPRAQKTSRQGVA